MSRSSNHIFEYLQNLVNKDITTEAERALYFWKKVKNKCKFYDPQINPPTIGVDLEGNINFCWSFKTLHLECEFMECRDKEVFYEYKSEKADYGNGIDIKEFESIEKMSSFVIKFIDGNYV